MSRANEVLFAIAWLTCAAACSGGDDLVARERGPGGTSSGRQAGAGGDGSDPFDPGNPAAGSGGKPSKPAEPLAPSMPSGNAGSIDPTCSGDCEQSIVGTGAAPFDPTAPGSTAIGLDADGALIIAPGAAASGPGFIWIANTVNRGCTGNTVSKIDTDTMTEVARYEVGFCDPSRTSVNGAGDVFVASREGRGVTKILVAGKDCPDTNGDGVITTSSGAGDVLPLGQDDCVAWWTPLPAGDIRGIAAQDVGGEVIVKPIPDAPPEVTVIPPKSFVWASGVNHSVLYKLDGETGAILFETEAPWRAYGAALDGNGLLWMTGGALGGADLGFVDTNQCLDAVSCNAPVCDVTCNLTSCPGTCDGAVKARVRLPGAKYGITVDCKQRVWLAGYGGSVQRYDHQAPPDMRLVEAMSTGGHGITADGTGRVWVGNQDRNTVSRIDGDSLQVVDIPMPNPKGMAVDSAGKVWAVRGMGINGGNSAHVIVPGAAPTDNTVMMDVMTGLTGAYTYSDMTGQQLRLAAHEPSVYVHRFEFCPSSPSESEPDYRNLTWDAELPVDSWIVFRIRAASTAAELASAAWIELGAVPGRTSPLDIAAFLKSADQGGRFVEVEVSLVSADGNVSSGDGCNVEPGTTPRVKSFGLSYECPDPGPS